MLSVLRSYPMANGGRSQWLHWGPIGLGLLVLYVPTFVRLGNGLWQQDEQLHGPIVLVVVLWLLWQQRDRILFGKGKSRPLLGVFCLCAGLLFYLLGRSQDIMILELGSLIPVLAGVLAAMVGTRAVWEAKFPLFFIAFMLPLPGAVVDALTGPLKQHVSAIAEYGLYELGYPIARTGVILSVGPYQLLVADACSGLHSLISMSAMGLLYLYLMGHSSIARNLMLAACLLPIAFAANIIRVTVLVLVTYHFGDEAGQGFIHGFSGIFLFVVGLLFLFAIDGLFARTKLFADRHSGGPELA